MWLQSLKLEKNSSPGAHYLHLVCGKTNIFIFTVTNPVSSINRSINLCLPLRDPRDLISWSTRRYTAKPSSCFFLYRFRALWGICLDSLSHLEHATLLTIPLHPSTPCRQDEYADMSDPLPEGLIGNLMEFQVRYTEVSKIPDPPCRETSIACVVAALTTASLAVDNFYVGKGLFPREPI